MSRSLKPTYEPIKGDLEDDAEGTFWEQIVASIGDEAAGRLSDAIGGRRVYIPRNPGPNHPITVAVGAEAAKALAADHSGRYVDVRLSPDRRARILELSAQKMQVSRIAQMLRCTERHVYKVREEAKASGDDAPRETPQPRLL